MYLFELGEGKDFCEEKEVNHIEIKSLHQKHLKELGL